MSTGNILYLVLCIGTFAVFAAVLAYMSHQQTKLGPETIGKPATQAPDRPDEDKPPVIAHA